MDGGSTSKVRRHLREPAVPNPHGGLAQFSWHRDERGTRGSSKHFEHPDAACALKLLWQPIGQGKETDVVTPDSEAEVKFSRSIVWEVVRRGLTNYPRPLDDPFCSRTSDARAD